MNLKPELSAAMKMRANEMYKLLKEKVYTNEELQIRFFGYCSSSNNRRIRDLISIVANKVPVIATSDSKGYWIATTKEDLEKVKHQWREFDSRIQKLEKRRQVLIKFCKQYGGIT